MAQLTVISHFYNEAYLLPFWLKHHVGMFDRGVMIDYSSTDESVSIIKRMAPGWEVVQSRNSQFGAVDVDREVMEYERSVSGWKIALNTTEFVFNANPRGYIDNFENLYPGLGVFGVMSYFMVDPPELIDVDPVPGVPLVHQRHHGFLSLIRRHRYFHKHPDGQYDVGRHYTRLPNPIHVNDLHLLWYGYSPFTCLGRARKLQIQDRIPDFDKRHQMGFEHIVTEPELFKRYREFQKDAEDLSLNPYFNNVMRSF
jgi:hypothetical protein